MRTTAVGDEDIKAAACDWLLRLSLETPNPDDRARFVEWCAEDPRHVAAYQRFQSIWQNSASLQELRPLASLEAAPDRWPRRAVAALRARPRRWSIRVGIAAAIGFFGVWMLIAPTNYATGIGQTRVIRLSDGSEVTLGARSSLDVAFRTEERRVALTAGEAFFSVTKNPARPFIVVVGEKQVRVVGTKFEVWRDTSEMRVSVVEGIVEVTQPPTTPLSAWAPPARLQAESTVSVPQTEGSSSPSMIARAAPVLMTAGQQVTADLDGAIEDPEAMPRGEPAAWRHGRLVYLDAPLREIIADANRYSRDRIAITDGRIADLRVSLTYPSDRIDQMLAALSRSLHLEIEHPSSGGILLKATGRSE